MLQQQIKQIINSFNENGIVPHFGIYKLRYRLSSLSDSSFRSLFMSYIPETENAARDEFDFYFALGYGELRRTFSPYDHILLHPNLKVAYIYIPKNACTTMKLSFMQSIRESVLEEVGGFPGNVHPVAEEELRIRSCALPDDLTTLVITRDPIERFWSAYIDKFIRHPEIPIINRFMREILEAGVVSGQICFDEIKVGDILEYLCGSGDHLIDKHFASQSAFIPRILPTFKIKIEHLNQFTSFITYLIGKPPRLSSSPHANSYAIESKMIITEGLTISKLRDIVENMKSPPPSSVLSESIKAKLKIRFEDDFELYRNSF